MSDLKSDSEFTFDLPKVGDDETPIGLPPRRPRRGPEGQQHEAAVDAAMATGRALAESAGTVTTTVRVTEDRADAEQVKARSCPMPNRIWDALTDRANRDRTTAKYFILKGLQMQGFPVRDEDLEDRRGSFIRDVARARRQANNDEGG